jgi:hypothetical protein
MQCFPRLFELNVESFAKGFFADSFFNLIFNALLQVSAQGDQIGRVFAKWVIVYIG